ncbi:lysozyme [Roseovarius sp. B08]|uniref:lysozyme n=1 Tax=Roseovarius sp. B08 TaxID=3449223 RepID=UPI003EDC9CC3
MKLVKNAGRIARRAHSMWGVYLTIAILAVPELIYWATGIDTPPWLWWLLALLVAAYTGFGRVVDQGIDRDKLESPWWIGGICAVLVLALALGDWRASPWGADPGATGPVVLSSASGVPKPAAGADAAFLAVAVPFVGRWEGLRFEAYRDIVGVWTVCYGETKGVKPGDRYTKAECDAMLAREILSYRTGLRRFFTAETIERRLPVPRDVAFSSTAYNVGVSAFGNSTAVRRLNGGDVRGACDALTWWNKAGGRVIRGLVNRRSEEKALCLKGVA